MFAEHFDSLIDINEFEIQLYSNNYIKFRKDVSLAPWDGIFRTSSTQLILKLAHSLLSII